MANFYKKSQFGRREQQKKAQSGRSMIEMLGVLAIIGVLSLVSISAYSQAMFKYQLNKYTEDFSTFLGNAISLFPEIRRQHGRGTAGYVFLGSFLANTSMLPDSMHYDQKRNVIYDLFKNKNSLDYHLQGNRSEYRLIIDMQRSDDKISARDRAICRNIFLVAKENYDNIYYMSMYNSGSGGAASKSNILMGGLSKANGVRLKDVGLNEIDNACSFCNSKTNCSIVIYLFGGQISG